jgi:hypothetical protein
MYIPISVMGVIFMTDLAKKEHKRWGKTYIDNRDWPGYNEQLVIRGEYFLALDWVRNWDGELQEMNRDKIGHPFEFPDSLIRLQSIWHDKKVPYRMVEGITRQLCWKADIPAYNDYSTINRRINQLDFHLELPECDNLTIFGDGSGFQAINGGEYLREKYGKKNRRWVQVIILGNPKTKEPVSFEVNLIPASEPESVKRQLKRLIDSGVKVSRFGGDGAFDDISMWQNLEANKIHSVIKPDENARDDGVCQLRNQHVMERNRDGYKEWARRHKYGKRWTATEGIFSAVKRIFGEQLVATSEIGLVQEAKSKVWAYQTIKRYGET